MVRLSDHPAMTIAVDWDIKQQMKSVAHEAEFLWLS